MKTKQNIFNLCSFIFLCLTLIIYMSRYVYYRLDNNKKAESSNILYEKIKEQDKRYELATELIKNDYNYYFFGKSKNNYVDYKGLIWRIIKFDKTNITMILDNSINNMPYDSVMKWLNNGNEDNTGIFYNIINGKTIEKYDRKYTFDENFINYCDKLNKDRFYLLDKNDYLLVGAEDSFINNKLDFWISSNDELTYVDNLGKIENETENDYHNIRPVIIIDSKSIVLKGNGTIDNPYYIKRDKSDTLENININSYIKYNDEIWKVIKIFDDKIKIANEDCIKDENNKCISMTYSYYDNDVTTHSSNNLIHYLNTTYYNSLKNKNYLTSGEYYIGKYENDDYTTIYSDSINLYVGLLTISDPHAFEIDNTYLLTSSKNSNLSIFIALDNHPYETLITEKSNIRPVLHMKKNISIESGNGTYESPYILGGIINEKN